MNHSTSFVSAIILKSLNFIFPRCLWYNKTRSFVTESVLVERILLLGWDTSHSFIAVPFQMLVQVPFRTEAFSALETFEWSFSCVGPLVNYKVRTALVSFITVRKAASVFSLTNMSLHMFSKMPSPSKGTIASIVRTKIAFFPIALMYKLVLG